MSDDTLFRARKNLTAIFRAFQQVGQSTVAKELSISDAQVSEWKTKDAEKAARILAAAGLKCVPISLKCYEPAQIEAILTLAKARISQIESADQLQWDDPE